MEPSKTFRNVLVGITALFLMIICITFVNALHYDERSTIIHKPIDIRNIKEKSAAKPDINYKAPRFADSKPKSNKEKIIEIVAITGMIVNTSVTEIDPDTCIWAVGQLEDGIAFLLVKEVFGRKYEGVYWVDSNGDAFAANGVAKSWSPSLSYSKTGIDYYTVIEAIKSFQQQLQ